MKQKLLDKLSAFLFGKGFVLKSLSRSCFDILARSKGQVLLIKILEDANSISRAYTEEMASVAFYLNASALIISEKAGAKLEYNVVYSRFSIHTLNFRTFVNCIENKFPFIKRSHAGLTVSVIGRKLKEKREEFGYSLNALSKKIGVTSRMVVKYESENSEMTVDRAMKLYDLFGYGVFNEINIFSRHEKAKGRFESEVSRKYAMLGFDAADTKKAPFDVIARKDDDLILTEVSDKVNPQLESLSKLLEADNLVIFNKKKPKNVPSMTKEEFMDFEKANELVRFLKEF